MNCAVETDLDFVFSKTCRVNRLRKHRLSTMKMVSFMKEMRLGQVVFSVDVALVVEDTFGLLEGLLVEEGPLETWFVSRFAVGVGKRFV